MRHALVVLAAFGTLAVLAGCRAGERMPGRHLLGSCANSPETCQSCNNSEGDCAACAQSAPAGRQGGIGAGLCRGCGGRGCGLCMRGAGRGAEAEGNFTPGPPTAAVTYPYYTVRGPRDFLARNPPSIGP
jgi:hypothetical protein